MKGRNDTIDEFVKIFSEWLDWRDTIPFMENVAVYEQSRTVEGNLKGIERLKQNS